ncbi:uncharacterized protein DC041_0010156, partial [Schistosoma bovis]
MPSADIDSSRHLISQPLWIKDPNYFDLQSSTRSDYLWDPRTSRKTEPEGIRARSFKPKVSAYKSTINWDLGEKAKSISCVHTQVNSNKFQNHSYSLTSLLDQQPRDWLIDDYDSKHKGWRRTDQIIRNKESFTKNSLYREQFPPKEAGEKAKSISCVHTQVNSNKFQNHSYSLTSLLDQQPRDWLIDDYDSKHKGWRRTDQIIRNKESFTKNSLYREQFPPKEAGEKAKSISCVHTQVNSNKFQNHSYSLTSLLDQQPRDWLIDDYDSKHKGWRRTDQIIRNKESFTKNSLYREQFPPKEAVHVQPVKPVHIPLKTSEKFTDKSVYTDEYIWRPILIDYNQLKHHKLCLPIEMIPSKPRDESNMITVGENVMSMPGTN